MPWPGTRRDRCGGDRWHAAHRRSGYLFGTVLGVLVLGLIQTIITFQGTLSSWWTRIVVGGLLFVFILLQRVMTRRG